jgi:hypothetical protein
MVGQNGRRILRRLVKRRRYCFLFYLLDHQGLMGV